MSERVTVDKAALESLKVSASPYRPNDAEFMRLRSNAIVLEASAQPLPPATHPVRLEHNGKVWNAVDTDSPAKPSVKPGDVWRLKDGSITPPQVRGCDESWAMGRESAFWQCGAALYREVKPLKYEETGRPSSPFVSIPVEFLGKDVRITVEEVLS